MDLRYLLGRALDLVDVLLYQQAQLHTCRVERFHGPRIEAHALHELRNKVAAHIGGNGLCGWDELHIHDELDQRVLCILVGHMDGIDFGALGIHSAELVAERLDDLLAQQHVAGRGHLLCGLVYRLVTNLGKVYGLLFECHFGYRELVRHIRELRVALDRYVVERERDVAATAKTFVPDCGDANSALAASVFVIRLCASESRLIVALPSGSASVIAAP